MKLRRSRKSDILPDVQQPSGIQPNLFAVSDRLENSDKNEEENDGLVSKSQRWTKMLSTEDGYRKEALQYSFPIRADHMDQMGWWNLNGNSQSRVVEYACAQRKTEA
ncbi:MAG: hypothetical protein R3C26_04540 [Calditrichia bacterium]